ncbi:MAG: hypothetical protein ACM3RX_06250 [Methanococcaceae archaeon]
MKTRNIICVCSLLLFNISCTEKQISDNEKKEALQEYTTCAKIADQWFIKLDSSEYQHLETLKIANGVDKDSVLSFINKIQKTYGRIQSREFLGAHIWSGKKLLTYIPIIEEKLLLRTKMQRSEDGFYIVNPKYFGFTNSGQMFARFPKAKYVVLMYRSVPTNISYAEEAVVLQYNSVGRWEVFTYKISDDI